MAAIVERKPSSPDHLLFNVTLLLLVVGVVAVYDSSYAFAMDRLKTGYDGFFFLKRQVGFAAAGLLAMGIVSGVGYWRLRRYAPMLLLFSIALLIMVWMPVVGRTINGASRWVGKGALQIQPSELAKLALVIYLAALLSKRSFNIKSLTDGLFAPVAVIVLIFLLVEREPDMGTAFVIFLAAMTVLYLAGARLRHLAAIAAGAACLGGLLLIFGHGFRLERIKSLFHKQQDIQGRDFQPIHGLYAVGSGGIGGLGLGAGREKYYLPEANTDYVFATIAEETGLLGSLALIGLLFVLGKQGFMIARRTRDPFGSMLAAGLAAMISWQAVLNLAVVTRIVPPTGIPLPFVSYGGTSLIFLMVAVGILLNISRHPDAPIKGVSG